MSENDLTNTWRVGVMGSIEQTKEQREKHLHLDIVGISLGGDLALDETLPSLVGLLDDVQSVLLVLSLAREGKLVLGLAIGDLVDAEPLVGGTDEAREVTLNILNVVQLVGKGIGDINDNDLPVSLAYSSCSLTYEVGDKV